MNLLVDKKKRQAGVAGVSGGYSAVPHALRAAGKTAGDAVNSLKKADCGAALADVPASLPGSTAAGAAAAYAKSWSDDFRSWCAKGQEHAADLSDAAAAYQHTERGNADTLHESGGH